MRIELHIECTGCGKIATLPPNAISAFDEPRLRCSTCGARSPKVSEVEVRVPYERGYKPDAGVTVIRLRSTPPGDRVSPSNPTAPRK
jgi:hypothetical protein